MSTVVARARAAPAPVRASAPARSTGSSASVVARVVGRSSGAVERRLGASTSTPSPMVSTPMHRRGRASGVARAACRRAAGHRRPRRSRDRGRAAAPTQRQPRRGRRDAPTTPVAATSGPAIAAPSTPPALRRSSRTPSSAGRPYARWRMPTSATKRSSGADGDAHGRALGGRRRRRSRAASSVGGDGDARRGQSSTHGEGEARHRHRHAGPAQDGAGAVGQRRAHRARRDRSTGRGRRSPRARTGTTASGSARWPSSWRPAASRRGPASTPGSGEAARRRPGTWTSRAVGLRAGFFLERDDARYRRVLVAGILTQRVTPATTNHIEHPRPL